MKITVKHFLTENIFRIITIFLLTICAIIPFYHAEIFNKDFLMYAGMFSQNNIDVGSLQTLKDNTFVFYLFISLFSFLDPFYTICLLQIITLSFFYFSLRKMHPVLLVSITLILFFTTFSNQIRTGLSLIFGFYALLAYRNNKYFSVLIFFILCIITHYLVPVVFISYLLIGSEKRAMKILIFTVPLLIIAILYFNQRLLYYLQPTHYYSYLGFFALIILLLSKHKLSKKQFIIFCMFVLSTIMMGFQAYLSSRISELIIFLIFYEVSYTLSTEEKLLVEDKYEKYYWLYSILFLSVVFFIYRFCVIFIFEQDGIIFRNLILDKLKNIY